MGRNNYGRINLNRIQPEVGLLGLASRGVELNLSPRKEDFQWVVKSLQNRKMVILFRWFWKHADVVYFAENYFREVKPENLEWYLNQLSKIIAKRRSLHWLERINLFHVYGLSRLFDKDSGLEIVRSFPFFRRKTKCITSLSDLSAWNVSLMLREADPTESLYLINSFADPALLAEYGLYQIYYYGGISQLVNSLRSYARSSKAAIVPQTVAGLISAQPRSLILSKILWERIYSEVVQCLPREVYQQLSQLHKKGKARSAK